MIVTVVVLLANYVAWVAVRSQLPVRVPRPPGPYAVGRVEDTVVDTARNRPLSVWTWYPAQEGTGEPAVYAPGAWSGLGIGLPVGQTVLGRVRDAALERATPAGGRFPLVVLLPGLGFAAPQYAALAENLASRGYVVVGVTPTGSANLTVLDGKAVGPTDAGNPPDFAGEQTSHDKAIARRLLQTWVADARFAADEAGRAPGQRGLAAHLDASRPAYVGHSFGGTTALQACADDHRCSAAVNLDGAMYGDVARRGLSVPSLLVEHTGSCIGGDCNPATAADRADQAAGRAYRKACTGPLAVVPIAGTGHLNFSDDGFYYWALPFRKLLGLGSADGATALAQAANQTAKTLAAG